MANVLKELLGDLYTEEIAKKVGDVKLARLDDGKYIPVEKFNAKLEEVKQLKETIDEREKQLKELQKKAKGNEELEQTIEELRAENEKKDQEYQSRINEQQKKFAVESAIKDAQGKNVKAIQALLDMKKITVDEKGITGLSEQLETIKTSDAYLFGEDKIVGSAPAGDKGQSPKPKEGLQAELKKAQDEGRLVDIIALKRKIAEQANETKT